MDNKDKGTPNPSIPIPNPTLDTLKRMAIPAACVLGGAVVIGVAVPATIAIVGFSTGGVAAGSAAAGIQAGIGNVAAGSAFAILQSAGTAPLLTGAIGAGVGAGGGAIAVLVRRHGATVISNTMPHVNKALKTAGDNAARTFTDTAPLVKGAFDDAVKTTGGIMVTIQGSAGKSFISTTPFFNGAINNVTKGAQDAVANTQGSIVKAFEDTRPWVSGAIGDTRRVTGQGAVAIGQSREDLLKAVRKIPIGSVSEEHL